MIGVVGFCGVAIIGLAYWNYVLSGDNDDLLEQKRRLELEVERLQERNERLLDDTTKQAKQLRNLEGLQGTVDLLEKNLAAQIEYNETLEAQVPLHDAKGRFKKKASQR